MYLLVILWLAQSKRKGWSKVIKQVRESQLLILPPIISTLSMVPSYKIFTFVMFATFKEIHFIT